VDYVSKELTVSGKAMGIGAVRVAGRSLIRNLHLSKSQDQSYGIDVALATIPWNWTDPGAPASQQMSQFISIGLAKRIPVETYFVVYMFACGKNALYDALLDATFPLAINGQNIATAADLLGYSLRDSMRDDAPDMTITFQSDADFSKFRNRLVKMFEISTVDSSNVNLEIPIEKNLDYLLLVPYVRPRTSMFASDTQTVTSGANLDAQLRSAITALKAQPMTNNDFVVLNSEAVISFNLE
jgi:hypothetical protein